MTTSFYPQRLAEIQSAFVQNWQKLLTASESGQLPQPKDRRFSNDAWQSNPGFLFLANAYLLSSHAMQQMVDAADVPESMRERLRFSVQQWLDAVAPSNFLATNPEVQQALLQSHGQSLAQGMGNFLQDMGKGYLSQTDESKFSVGENLAVTPGQVVFENSLFQLIQYQPQTAQVHRIPLLMVPPCINKYYILDLQPQNSFVNYAVQQGFTVFMVSWRNPLPTDTDGILQAGWDDYIQDGVLEAVQVVQDISGQKKINALGFCVGGTLLGCALAVARARGDDPVNALTLLTSFLDFSDTGILDVFINERHVETRELQASAGTLMTARELSTTFSFLRPNELVWNYVVNNYLKGRTPPAFDLLYWNGDGTNLPGPFFAWYLRNTYLENNLIKRGKVSVGDTPIDLSRLDMPAFVYGSREDHIVPWRSAFASTDILQGPLTFVLGASGHIAGVVNPPAAGKRSHWVGADPSHCSAQQWLDQAQERSGSWWPVWAEWLAGHAGSRKRAVQRLGNARFSPLEPAPGRYVKVRAV